MFFNLGPCLEIADTESVAATEALKVALQATKREQMIPQKVYLCIDSQLVIQRLKNNFFNTTLQAIEYVKELKQKGIRTVIIWVLSYIGITGNELADLLAKKATQKPVSQKAYTSISYLRANTRAIIIQK